MQQFILTRIGPKKGSETKFRVVALDDGEMDTEGTEQEPVTLAVALGGIHVAMSE